VEAGKEAMNIERQFRLLREDMVAPMKSELESQRSINSQKRIFSSPTVGEFSLVNCEQNKSTRPILYIDVRMPPDLEWRLKRMSEKDQKKYLESTGKRVLGRESVVLFCNASTDGSLPQVVHVGVIKYRDNNILQKGNILRVGVAFFSSESLRQVLLTYNAFKVNEDKGHHRRNSPISKYLLQVSFSLFSYEPILKRLNSMENIPFSRFIYHGDRPGIVDEVFSDEPDKVLGLNKSQKCAVTNALKHDFSLIQVS
jgi:hypothetical protein